MRLSDEILGGFGGGLKSLILSRLSDFWIIRRREDEKLEIDLKFWIVVRRLGADLNVLKCIYTYSFNLAPRSFNCRLARGRSSCSLQVPYRPAPTISHGRPLTQPIGLAGRSRNGNGLLCGVQGEVWLSTTYLHFQKHSANVAWWQVLGMVYLPPNFVV